MAQCVLCEGWSLSSARGPLSFRSIRQLLTGEPCAGEPHARFGGRGVRPNRTSLPLSACRHFVAGVRCRFVADRSVISHLPQATRNPVLSCSCEWLFRAWLTRRIDLRVQRSALPSCPRTEYRRLRLLRLQRSDRALFARGHGCCVIWGRIVPVHSVTK